MSPATATFPEGSTVLVTGANGHVAQHVVQQLLDIPSVKVKATVRSASSSVSVERMFHSHITAGSLDIVQVSDITQDGAFDAAIQDCTHVAHVASPLIVGSSNAEEDVLKPALRGTLSLLGSAGKANRLQSIVITGSFAAVMDPMQGSRPGYIYTPADWNPMTYEEAADPALDLQSWPKEYRQFVTYMASKKVAERGAWDWYYQHKPEWSLSYVTHNAVDIFATLQETEPGREYDFTYDIKLLHSKLQTSSIRRKGIYRKVLKPQPPVTVALGLLEASFKLLKKYLNGRIDE